MEKFKIKYKKKIIREEEIRAGKKCRMMNVLEIYVLKFGFFSLITFIKINVFIVLSDFLSMLPYQLSYVPDQAIVLFYNSL